MAESTQVPDEIQEEYYAPERKERTGVAWLLAIGTLILTVLLATGLFFAGRWTYRQIAGDGGESDTPATVENQNGPAEEEQVAQGNNNSGNNGAGAGGSGDDDNQDNGNQGQEEQRDDQNNNSEDNSDDDNHGETLGTTGDDPSQDDGRVAGESTEGDLPSTGPTETVAVFVAVTVFGYLVHRFNLLKS